MRRLVRWTIITLGVAALVRWLKRRGQEPAPALPAEDPADELRRKLAESRADDEPAAAVVEPPSETVDDRRAEVHAKGHSALSEMAPPDEG